MKAITYHYIREEDKDFPDLIYLHSENFFKQLVFFDYKYGIFLKEEFLSSVERGQANSRKVLLTFDDGLSDHYDNVFPYLKNNNYWGIFYVSIGPYLNERLLDVHRIHIILATLGGNRSLMELKKILEPQMLEESRIKEFDKSTYKFQNSGSSYMEFKKTLNYYVSDHWKSILVSNLIRQVFSTKEEKKFTKQFYLTIDQIKRMHASGMMIGAHSINHNVLSTLQYNEQKKEVEDSCDFLSSCIGENINTFAYPYGTKKTYTKKIEKIISNKGIDFTFAIDGRDISSHDLKNNLYSLPRYDCNQFKYGKNETPKEYS